MSLRFRNLLFIFIISTLIKIVPALTISVNSSDACTYIDIARNLLENRGFVCSYNVYQYWPGAYYPAWTFMQPLFPLLAAAVWFFVPSVHSVMILNVFICGLNVILLYLIVQKLYDEKLAFWSALLVSVMYPVRMTAVMPWTEHLHLLFFLLAIIALSKNGVFRPCFVAGILIGASVLVRVSGFFFVFILAAAFLVTERSRSSLVKKLSFFCAGFLLVMAPYEAFCLLRYDLFYPEYPIAAKNFTLAAISGGEYSSLRPVLTAKIMPDFSFSSLTQVLKNVFMFAAAFIKDWPLILIVTLAYRSIKILSRKVFLEILLLFLGIGHIALFSFSFWWLPENLLETHRYLLIPLAMLAPIAVKGLMDAGDLLKEAFETRYKYIYFPVICSCLFVFFSYPGIKMSHNRMKLLFYEDRKETALRKTAEFFRDRTGENDIIATSEYQEQYGLSRPVVSIPEGKAENEENIMKFIEIYKPSWFLISRPRAERIYRRALDGTYIEEKGIPSVLDSRYMILRRVVK